MPPKHGYHCEECSAPLVPVYALYACRVPVCPYARKGKGKMHWTLDNEGKGKRTLNLQGEEQDHVGKGKRTLNLQGEEQDRMHHWRGSLEITAVASTPMPQAQSSEGNIARLEGGTEVLLRPKRRLRPLSKMPGRAALGLAPSLQSATRAMSSRWMMDENERCAEREPAAAPLHRVLLFCCFAPPALAPNYVR